MRPKLASPDQAVARIAQRQHGVVALGQLIGAGLTPSGVARRVRSGRFHRVHRGVYAAGHGGLGNEGRWIAAVLACGAGAVLSHRTAAELWRLLEPGRGPSHVTVPTAAGRARRSRLRIHRSPSLSPQSTTVRHAIPVTTVARTLADLRGAIGPSLFRRAVRQAEYLGFETGIETDRTRSDAERAFLRLCRRHGLAAPEVNVRVGVYTVDFLWRDRRLAVEVDGYAAHRGRQAFEDDRARELHLHTRGLRLRRFSATQIAREPEAIAASLLADGAFRSVSDRNSPGLAP